MADIFGTLYDRGGAVINVKHSDFGVTGDGATNDRAAIQAAIDATPEGGILLFPEGEYVISSALTIINRSITLQGVRTHRWAEDPRLGGAFIRLTAHSTNAVTIQCSIAQPSIGNYHVAIRDMGFYGPGPSGGQTGHGIHALNSQSDPHFWVDVELENVGIRHFDEHGLFLEGAFVNLCVRNLGVSTCGKNGVRAERGQYSPQGEHYWDNITIHSCGQTGTTQGTKAGLYYDPGGESANAIVRLSSSTNLGPGAMFGRGTVQGMAWQFESNGGPGGTDPVVLFGISSTAKQKSVCVAGLVIFYHTGGSGYAGPGVKFDNCDEATLAGTYFSDPTSSQDVVVTANAQNVKVLGYRRGNGSSAAPISDSGTRTMYLLADRAKLPSITASELDSGLRFHRTPGTGDTWDFNLDNGYFNTRDLNSGTSLFSVLPVSAGGGISSVGPIRRSFTQVVDTRKTGWATPTGAAARTSFDTSTVTTQGLAQRVKALIDDLTAHGLIGP